MAHGPSPLSRPSIPITSTAHGTRMVMPPAPYIGQQGWNLCWAACMEMVAQIRLPATAWTQCRIVEQVTATAAGRCCSAPMRSGACDKGCGVRQVEFRYARIGIPGVHRRFANSRSLSLRPALQHEIDHHRPVQIGWSADPGLHFALVVGYGTDATGWFAVVHDPASRSKNSAVYWDDLLSPRVDDVNWLWTWTWLNL